MISKEKENNYWWTALIFVAAGIALLFFMPIVGYDGKLYLDFGNGQKRAFSGPADGRTTLLLALYRSSQQGGFEVRYSVDADGNTKIQSIAGMTNYNSGKTWHFYLNHRPISGADLNRVIIHRGDLAEINFE